jgi:hypothetical protein
MPAFYNISPGATQTTNAVAGTENDCFFIKPGATRSLFLTGLYFAGKGALLTSISGIIYRLKQWTTTSSSGGTALTPAVKGPFLAATATAGFAAATVTSGTGGPTLKGAWGSGSTSPSPWIALNLDQAYEVDAAANNSLDIFNSSLATSLNFEMSADIAE